MTSTLFYLARRGAAFLTPNASRSTLTDGVSTAREGTLFPKVDATVDGDACDRDCQSCTVSYPPKWQIDETARLYGGVSAWSTHLLVATGKSDWTRDVADEKGSVMEAVAKYDQGQNGTLKLSASNMPLPLDSTAAAADPDSDSAHCTAVLLLPAFTMIDNVTPDNVPDLIDRHVLTGPTNTTTIKPPCARPPFPTAPKAHDFSRILAAESVASPPSTVGSTTTSPPTSPIIAPTLPVGLPLTITPAVYPKLVPRPCPHNYLILLCSQRSRDVRCGQSAPLLRREFERHLRPLGLYRDLHDQRPGGVGIYFISHVGGHKFSANVLIYRRAGLDGLKKTEEGDPGRDFVPYGREKEEEVPAEAGQCIWLARVRPEDCEGIIKFTVLQGKVVKPERQLRGGFDREKGLVSW